METENYWQSVKNRLQELINVRDLLQDGHNDLQ